MDAHPKLSIEIRNVAVLGACQAVLVTCSSILITLNTLAGRALATEKWLATLPVTAWVTGGAVTTYFASLSMRRIGRRAGFVLGTVLGIIGGSVSSIGVWRGSF